MGSQSRNLPAQGQKSLHNCCARGNVSNDRVKSGTRHGWVTSREPFQRSEPPIGLRGQAFLLLRSADVQVRISLVGRRFGFADVDWKTHIGQHRTKRR